ncbi:hypothetical protein L210DRAFT_2983299 [Boletus edulis BED1]|uniref:Protein-S-isoprenylcysteine O-methyltransferase n=1 Tax=Boletus edulis BED1 TaxID=1328754 RepID=A0AAD4BIX5_BOLED|nr:hypothetical protein L210DRAFT_2983299 [Boletus edulis BED1]
MMRPDVERFGKVDKWALSYRKTIYIANSPLDLQLHTVLLWCIAVFEVVCALNHYFGATFSPSLSTRLDTAICSIPRSHIVTPLFVIGVLTTVVGIHIQYFRELGQLLTFDPSILPGHKLVTSGWYGYVHHPSYTSSMPIVRVAGLAFSHLTAGSLAVKCSVLRPAA